MKKIFLTISFNIILFFFVSCSNEKLPTPPISEIENFPSTSGTFYKYNVNFLDSSTILGIRKSTILAKSNSNSNNSLLSIYQPQVDSVVYNGNILIDTSYFRKTSNGVFYFIDTTGFFQLIPDSLRSFIVVDTESRALFFPLSLNQTWPVYQIDIKVAGFPIYSPLKAYARVFDYQKMEFVSRNSSTQVDVFKVEYTLEIQLSPTSEILIQSAIAHFGVGLGFVRWEGHSSVVNLVRGSTILYPSELVLEELFSHFIP